jgi:hypothetical protein
MKAWIVDDGGDCCTLVHAETIGKAKLKGQSALNVDYYDYLYVRAKRIPGLDDKPITYQNAKDAGFQYIDLYGGDSDEDGYLKPELFFNDCYCEICKGSKHHEK